MPVSLSGGTIKEVTDSPGFLRTTDLWRVSLEAETTSSPSWKKSTRERIATSEPATGREATRPATDTIDTTVWSTDSARDLHSSVAAHSEPSMGTSPKNTTSITVKAAVPTVTTTGPESTRAGTELDHPLTTGLGESSTYTDTNSTTEMSIVHSPGSVVITRGSRTEGTTSDRISIAALAQSTASSDMARPSTLPAMGGSERMTITMQNGPSGTTPRAAPNLEKSATASLSGTHLAVTQGFPQSSVVTSSTNRDITVSTSLTNSSNTVTIQTDSTSSLVPELRETSTIQRNSSATDKITVLSKEPTAALTEVSRTEPTSSSSMPTPGPVQSAVSPDTTAGIITRPSASSVRTASEEMTITTQTGTPGATSQGTLSLDTSTKASVVVTQSLTQSPLTTLMSRGPSSVEATSSPSSPVPLPAGRSPSSESSTFPGRSPSSPTPATSILTHSLAKTTDMVSTSLEPGTSSPSSQISTNIEMLSTSEAPTGTGALRPSENTAVTNGISTSSGRETHSSAPADSEPPRASSPALASSTSSDTSVSTSIPPSSVTTTIETDSTSSLNPELRDTSTIQQNSSATQDVTVFSKVPTGTTTEVSSSMSIPGTFQSTMSPDTPAGIITKPSAASVRTTSAEMTITTQTGPPGAASQGTRTLDALPKASVAGTHSAVTQSLTQSPLTTLMSRGPSSGEATSSPSSPVPLPAGTSPAPESSTLPGRSPASPSPGTSHHTPGLVKTTEPFGTISEPAATLPPTLSSTKAEMLFTSEFSIGSAKVFPSIYTTVTTAGSSSSGHDRSSSVPVFSKSSSPSYPVGTASTLGETTFSTSMHSSFETTGFDTKTLSRLTPGLNETSTALASGSETLTSTPSSPVSTHVWRSPETDATSPVKLSVPDQPLPSQDTQIPVETVTRFYGSPSVAGSAGTAVPTSHLSVSVTESTHHASTDTLSSAETILADALTSSPSEAVASFATSGVAGAISATLSASPFSRTESGPKGAALSTMAETLLSSTASPSSILSTSDASTSPLPRWLTSTPAATRTADSSLKAESSTARGPLVMVSTLKTWTQPFRTSLSPMADTRMTESVGLGPVTSSQVLPHSTRLTRTDGIVKSITKIPNEAVHGGTTVHVPLASTSAGLRGYSGLPMGGTEQAEATATALKTTSTVTFTARVSSPTSRTLPPLGTSGQPASTSTTGMIVTTPDVPKMTASLATRPGEETSTAVPMTTPSIFSGGPETTPSLVPRSGAETSAAVPALTVSFGEPETTTSRVTHPAGTSPTVSRAVLNVSHGASAGTPTTATRSGEEVSSAIPAPAVSPDVLGMVTSLVTSPGTETSPALQTLAISRGKPGPTVSLVTHPGIQASSGPPTPAVSPSVSGVEISSVTSSGAENSTAFPAVTDAPHELETAASGVTHPGTEASSTVPTLTVSPGEPETTAPQVPSTETSTPASKTTLNFSPSELDTTSSTAVSHGAEASSATPVMTVSPSTLATVTSLVIGSGTDTRTTVSPLAESLRESESTVSLVAHPAETSPPVPRTTSDVSHGDLDTRPSMATSLGTEASSALPATLLSSRVPDTSTSQATSSEKYASGPVPTRAVSPDGSANIVSWATHSGAQTSSAIPTLTVSPGEPDATVSLVTHPGAQITSAIPTVTVSPGVSEAETSLVTSSGAETSTTFPTLTDSTHKPETTASWVSHSAETSPPVSKITPTFSHSESHTTFSTATSPGAEVSSAVPATAVSPGVPGMVTSLATYSGAETSTTLPALTDSPQEPETTASRVTRSGKEGSSAVPTMTVSLGKPETTVSLLIHPEETSPTVPRTTSNVPYSESDTTPSMATSPGTKASSAFPATTASPGVPGMVTSLVTSSGAETSTTFPTLTDSMHKPETAASWVTHSGTETSSAVPTLTSVSPGEPETTVSLVTHPEETSPAAPRTTPNVSHGKSDTTPSVGTSLEAKASSAVPAMTVSPHMSEVVTSEVTSSGAETSTTFPTLIASPHQLETTASWVIHSGTEASSAVPTMTVSPGKQETTFLLATHPEETSPAVPRTTPSVSHSESDTTHSVATSPGTKASSAVPATTVSPHISEAVTSEVTSSGAETSTTFPTLIASPRQLETTASWVIHSGTEARSAVPTMTVSAEEPATTVLLVTHPSETSPALPRTSPSVSHSELDSTSSVVSSPGAKTSSAVPTPTVSRGVPGRVTSQVTSTKTDASMAVPTLTLSPGEPVTTASLVTHPGVQTSSATPTPTVSSTVPGLMTSLATSSGAETSTTFLIPTDSPHKSKTTASWVTHSKETSTPVSRTTPGFSHSRSDTMPSTATSSEAEASSAVPTPTVSPGGPHMVTSLVTRSAADISTTFRTLTGSTHKPETTASWVTHSETEASSAILMVTVAPGKPETTVSLVTHPEETSPTVPRTTPSVSHGTASPSTHPGTHSSTAVSTSALPHGSPETTGLQPTRPAAGASTSVPALTVPPGVRGPSSTPATTVEPYTVTSWGTEPSPSATSVGLPESSKTVPGDTVTLITSETSAPPKISHGEGLGTTTSLKTTTVETTHLAATRSGPTVAETTATFSPLAGSPFVPVTTSGMSTLASVSVTSGTTAVPFLMPFTVNFTITSLHYTEDMGNSESEIFGATERDLQHVLRPLFKNSSIGSLYAGCRLALFRADEDGGSTRMDAVCTYRPDPTGFRLDRERLYWELSQQTRGVTRLGPFTLDRDSLYINGYNHRSWIPATRTPVTTTFSPGPPASLTPVPSSTVADMGPALLLFTLNFTVTNLLFIPDMGHRGSAKFSSTEKTLNHLLGPVFRTTSVGPLYTGCRLTRLRTEKDGAATGVDAICTYHPDPSRPGLDREKLYQELSQLTHGVTRLGTYTLDSNTLYVNGYHRRSWPPTTSTPVTSTFSPEPSSSPALILSSTAAVPFLVPFTVNFTITNLRYEEDMQLPGSWKFNATERILQELLKPAFKNSSLGFLYSGCGLASLRPEKDGAATRVDAICMHRPDPEGSGLDREQLYWELSQWTHSVTRLGPYMLDRDSLYVNGFTHQISALSTSTPGTSAGDLGTSGTPFSFSSPTATSPTLVPFTLNMTITNLQYTPDMGRPGSAKFNMTEEVLRHTLGSLLKSTSIGPLHSGCRLTALRPEKNGSATGVDAVCTHRPEPTGPRLHREWLYWELSLLTHGVTQLGPYTLDQDSLYVNGYTHQTSATTPNTAVTTTPFPMSSLAPPRKPTAADLHLVSFTLNFTITNVYYTEDMGHPASLKFSSTERILQHQLRALLSKTSVGPLDAGCRLESLRREKGGAATGVDMVCTLHSDPAAPELDRERLYWELSHETHGVSQLGSFTLDGDSLYVNGYTYGPAAATTPTEEVSKEPFTLNFTIDNLRFSADMGRPSSLKFNITDTLMQHLLSPLFQRSSLGARYAGCRVTSLRSVKNGAKTGVDILCTYQQPSSGPGLPAKQVFHELSRQTRGITRLGPYSLDKDSLYLNGYHERGPDEPPTTPEPSTTFLPTSSSPVQPESTTAVGHNLKTLTLNFTISNLPYSPDASSGSAIFNSTERVLQRLLGSLFQKTSLGPSYSGCSLISLRPGKDGAATSVHAACTYHPDPSGRRLDRGQLYWELNQLTSGVTQMGLYTLVKDSLFVNGYAPQSSSIRSEYQLNFRIVNWNLSNPDATSSEYIALLRDIQDKVTTLYRSSQLQDVFRFCLVTNLTLDSMSVTIKALLSSSRDPGVLKQVFLDKTLNASSHWLGATYQLTDVHVTEIEPVRLPTDQPTSSPSFQHFLLNFTVTNILYSQDIAQPGTTEHQRNKRNIEDALNWLFRNSSIESYFSDCQVLAFRSVPHSNHTGVDSVCNVSPLARRLDSVTIYEEFLRLTKNGTQLQNFTLDRNSILVDGYSPQRNDVLSENSDLPFWAIILICLAGLLVLITCLICCFLVTVRRKKEGDYEVQQQCLGYYLPHPDLRKLQ
ncbi:mucin-16 isoform X3 [Camelus ferus]|uniref:Mucin-16 isoform X3 n=1 Tax=Camelus ferus TaxID=419612 RepID=A0A8B8RVW6_CAMFR|nr:mucin-16 isoform X3 [Camelus ferus]